MKKPSKKKYPKRPSLPKGGIKTEAQLKAYETKVNVYNKKVSEIDKDYKEKMKKWEAFNRKVDQAKNKLRR